MQTRSVGSPLTECFINSKAVTSFFIHKRQFQSLLSMGNQITAIILNDNEWILLKCSSGVGLSSLKKKKDYLKFP